MLKKVMLFSICVIMIGAACIIPVIGKRETPAPKPPVGVTQTVPGVPAAITPSLPSAPSATPGQPIPTLPPTSTKAAPTAAPTFPPSSTPVPTKDLQPPPCTKKGETWVSPADGATLVCVPEGSFLMGSNAYDADDDAKPAHTVALDAYWIDQAEVTNSQFEAFVNATGYLTEAQKGVTSYYYNQARKAWEKESGASWKMPKGPGSNLAGRADFPVVLMSWQDADTYCRSVGRRLPTEAEWEKAARGTDARKYPWGDEFPNCTLANFNKTGTTGGTDYCVGDVLKVGSLPRGSSPYGAWDMVGNVSEWVADWYSSTYYKSSPVQNPKGPSSGRGHIYRGGNWSFGSVHMLVYRRMYLEMNVIYDFMGFRCAVSAGK
ncbi:MAG TPA: SUMF1/EgtB/PvdO family nonheme iron enzyme [Anaerolineaceae bacterium]